MAKKKISDIGIFIEDGSTANLNAVTSATDGDAVDTRWYKSKSIFVNVSGNTGAVTVNIEGSYNGEFSGEETTLSTTTYTATNTNDVYYTPDKMHIPYMRTTTTSQTNSTVTTVITGSS